MAWLIQRGKTFYVGYRKNGKASYESTGTSNSEEAETKKLEKELELRIDKGPVEQPSRDISLEQLFKLYQEQSDVKESTLKLNIYTWNKLMELAGVHSLEDLQQDDLGIRFKKAAQVKKYSSMLVSLCLRNTKKLLRFAVSKGLIKKNPLENVTLPEQEKVARFLTEEEEKHLMEAASPVMKQLIQVELDLGLRLQQLVTLDWSQYDARTQTFYIAGQKRQKARYIPALPKTLLVLGEPKLKGRIFPVFEMQDPETSIYFVKRHWTKTKTKARIKGRLRFHDLRHTCASRLAQKLTPYELRDYFGWSSVALCDRYTHTRVEDIRKKLSS